MGGGEFMQKGNTLVIVLVIVGILVIGGAVAFFMTQSQSTPPAEETVVEETHDESLMMEQESMEKASNEAGMEETMEADVTIEVSGKNFSFDPEEITVKQGDTVKIVFTSESGFHDWVIDEFDAATDQVQTGETSEVTFVADQAGEFEYYCSVGNHRQMGMVGTLIVEE